MQATVLSLRFFPVDFYLSDQKSISHSPTQFLSLVLLVSDSLSLEVEYIFPHVPLI